MSFPRFGIPSQVAFIGYSCQIVDKGSPTFNDYGDLSGATYTYYNTTAIIQQMSVLDDEVMEGKMQPQDIVAFIDDSTSISGALLIGNFISGSFFGGVRKTYEIKGVEQLQGHYEIIGAKL